MAYNIGQLRRNQITTYSNPVSYTVGKKKRDDISDLFDFEDISMNFSSALSSLKTYYLRFSVRQRVNDPQEFVIQLQTKTIQNSQVQNVRKLTAKGGPTENKEFFEIIFTPNTNYDLLVFQLNRNVNDYTTKNESGSQGRLMDIEILEFKTVENIIPSLSGVTTLKKIGIQGPPGLLFTLNGEEIRVGRSGVYELYFDGLEISYIGFVIKESKFTQDGLDYFIMDYRY